MLFIKKKMLMYSMILYILNKGLTKEKSKTILYSRIAFINYSELVLILYKNSHLLLLEKDITIFNGLLNNNIRISVFTVFTVFLTSIILLITSFFPRKIIFESYCSFYYIFFSKLIYPKNKILNRMSEQYKIIEYSLIILFIIMGALFLICSNDIIFIFLSIELQSYGLYILSTLYKNSESSTNAGLMYFLLGGLSSCILLLGLALLYVNSGNTNLDGFYIINSVSGYTNATEVLYNGNNYQYYIQISLVFVSVGFLFKIASAPFHFWSPYVYDAIPTVVTVFVAIIGKISILIFLLDLIYNTSKYLINISWKNNLILSSVLSLIIGSVLGLTQFKIKRLYAYSSISHIGFLLLALTIESVESTQAFFFYLIQYSISNINAFIILILIGYFFFNYVSKDRNKNITRFNVKKLNTKNIEGQCKKNFNNECNENFNMNECNYEHNKDESKLKKNTFNDCIEDFNVDHIYNLQHSDDKSTILNFGLENNGKSEIEDGKSKQPYAKISSIELTTEKEKLELKDINNSPVQHISQIKGFSELNPILSISLSITLFSFIGVPPLIGFFGKQMILSAALDKGYIFVTLVAILTSVISAVYYLMIVKNLFFENPNQKFNLNIKNINIMIKFRNKTQTLLLSNNNIILSSSLTSVVSIITLVILLFIFACKEWLIVASVLAVILFYN